MSDPSSDERYGKAMHSVAAPIATVDELIVVDIEAADAEEVECTDMLANGAVGR